MTEVASTTLADTRRRCLRILHDTFKNEQGWVKIHAAEALLDLGEKDWIQKGILAYEGAWDGSSEIGKWRVLYTASNDHLEKQYWIGEIENCYTAGPTSFQLNALESLCKLNFVATADTFEKLCRDATDASRPEAPFALWALHLAGNRQAAHRISEILFSSDPEMRKLAAFCLRWMKCSSPAVLSNLAESAKREPEESEAFPFTLGAAISLRANPERSAEWRCQLVKLLETAFCTARYEICQALKRDFTQSCLPTLLALLDQSDADVRIGGSAAITFLLDEHLPPTERQPLFD